MSSRFIPGNIRAITRVIDRLYKLGATVLTYDQTALDLYCGAGAISLQLAQRAGAVIGVDIVPEAIRDAMAAAELAGLGKITQFISAPAEKWLRTYIDTEGDCHLAVLDPPRKGCDPELLSALLDAAPPRIVYVSCNPATLARDVALLQDAYRVSSVQPVDMFPWTPHVETVLILTKIDRRRERLDTLWSRWEKIFDEVEKEEDWRAERDWREEKEDLLDLL